MQRSIQQSTFTFSSSSCANPESLSSKPEQRIRAEKNRIPELYEEENSVTDSPKLRYPVQSPKLSKYSQSNQESKIIKEYETALTKGINEIDRLNNLLRIRETQVSALSNQFRSLSTSYNSLLQNLSHLEEQNTILKKKQQEQEKILLELHSKPHSTSFLNSESKTGEQYIQDLEKQNSKLRSELAEEKKKNRQKNKRIAQMSSKVKEIEEFKAHEKRVSSNYYSPHHKDLLQPQNNMVRQQNFLMSNSPSDQKQQPNMGLKSHLQLQSNLSVIQEGNLKKNSSQDKNMGNTPPKRKQYFRVTGLGNSIDTSSSWNSKNRWG